MRKFASEEPPAAVRVASRRGLLGKHTFGWRTALGVAVFPLALAAACEADNADEDGGPSQGDHTGGENSAGSDSGGVGPGGAGGSAGFGGDFGGAIDHGGSGGAASAGGSLGGGGVGATDPGGAGGVGECEDGSRELCLPGAATLEHACVDGAWDNHACSFGLYRASVDSSGKPVYGGGRAAISADGRFVAFESSADDVVPGDTNGFSDIFVHDLATGVTKRVSVSNEGAEGDDNCFAPSITGDGRFVTFYTGASTLVPGDTNRASDVFLRDLQEGTTERVSVSSSGVELQYLGAGASSISADGRYVAFTSTADNLVDGETHPGGGIYLRDRQQGTTSIASLGEDGGFVPYATTDSPGLTPDGRYLVFASYGDGWTADDTNGFADIFRRDLVEGTLVRVSVSSSGEQGSYDSLEPSISNDGRFVAFRSRSSELVPGDTNNERDIFVRDITLGTTRLVSVSSTGVQGNNHSVWPRISGDGRYVTFDSFASTLVPNDVNDENDIFIHDRVSGTTRLLSVNRFGVQANDGSALAAISADGRFVAFASSASNLLPGSTFLGGEFVTFAHAGVSQQ